jgi:hypothetical protein
MNGFDSLGIRRPPLGRRGPNVIEHVIVQRPLDRILAFTGFSIDDVVNDPIAKNAVIGYFKVYKQVQRVSEVVDLERQWNPGGVRL